MKLVIVECRGKFPAGKILSNHTIYDMKKQERVAAGKFLLPCGLQKAFFKHALKRILVQVVWIEGKYFTKNWENLF